MKSGSCGKTELYDPSLHYNSYFHSQQTNILSDFYLVCSFILDSSFLKAFFLAAFAHKQQPVDPQRWLGLTLSLTCYL